MSAEPSTSVNRYFSNYTLAESPDCLLRRNAVGLPAETLARFLAKIKIVPGACWEWIGGRFPTGYGMFNLGRLADGKQITAYAHRLAYELAYGPLESLQANHACDHRPCCNPGPGHIYAGTQTDNLRDRSQRSRPWTAARLPLTEAMRRQIVAECLSSKAARGTMARLAREHRLSYAQLAHMVMRARKREFEAATTGSMSAHRS